MSEQIKILIYDLREADDQNFTGEPGFYYTFPPDEDDKSDVMLLSGPYETREETVAAAEAFIRDALSEFQSGGE